MSLFLAIVGAIFAFFIVVLIHEAGHFMVARWLKIRVFRFSVGFGKPIFRYVGKDDIEYVIGILPLGGYVKMDDNYPSPFARILVALAGPVANFILAVVVFAITFSIGISTLKPIIASVSPHSIAARAGIKPGDQIVRMDDAPAYGWPAVVMGLVTHMGDSDPLTAQVMRNHGRTLKTVFLDMRQWSFDPIKPNLLQSFGVKPRITKPPALHREQYPFYRAWVPAIDETKKWTVFQWIVLKKVVMGQISLKTLGGPVSIFHTAGSATLAGLTAYLQFIALISVTLGFFNLLPIPALDGGHFLISLIEIVTQKPVSMRVQILLINIGITFLFLLMFYATTNDVLRLFH